MTLHVLPDRVGGAAENMALDFLLLQRYPQPSAMRFRHYGWHRPAFTFGYSQKIEFVRSQLPTTDCEICRRPTGGGVVDHRDDWTYALVLPRGHPFEELRATQSYRSIHECVATALRLQGVPAGLQPSVEPQPPSTTARNPTTRGNPAEPVGVGLAGICFQRAEVYDVVNERTGEKIAGGAQKRNKHGLLLQGSIWRPATGMRLDWEKFREELVTALGAACGLIAEPVPWPEFDEDEIAGLVEQYSSPDWIEYR